MLACSLRSFHCSWESEWSDGYFFRVFFLFLDHSVGDDATMMKRRQTLASFSLYFFQLTMPFIRTFISFIGFLLLFFPFWFYIYLLFMCSLEVSFHTQHNSLVLNGRNDAQKFYVLFFFSFFIYNSVITCIWLSFFNPRIKRFITRRCLSVLFAEWIGWPNKAFTKTSNRTTFGFFVGISWLNDWG